MCIKKTILLAICVFFLLSGGTACQVKTGGRYDAVIGAHTK